MYKHILYAMSEGLEGGVSGGRRILPTSVGDIKELGHQST